MPLIRGSFRRSARERILYAINDAHADTSLISCTGCNIENVLDSFDKEIKRYNRAKGRFIANECIEIIQTFVPQRPIDAKIAHEIGKRTMQLFDGLQAICATHTNTNCVHNHIVINHVIPGRVSCVKYSAKEQFEIQMKSFEEAKRLKVYEPKLMGINKSLIDDMRLYEILLSELKNTKTLKEYIDNLSKKGVTINLESRYLSAKFYGKNKTKSFNDEKLKVENINKHFSKERKPENFGKIEHSHQYLNDGY